MARTDTLGNFLTDVAEAIRTKKGTTNTIQASNFDTEIASIEGGGKYAPRFICFYNCPEPDLQDEVDNLDTSNITNAMNMFNGCNKLTNLDLSNFNTSNMLSMARMFSNCSLLTTLNLSSFDTTNTSDISYMFSGCRSLTLLDIRNIDFTNVTSYSSTFSNVPADCEIIVKDDTAKNWITTNFTTLTNIKTVAELEASA